MLVGLDIETTGLDPRQDRLVLVALAFPDGEVKVFEASDPQLGLTLQSVWGETLVCHFATFDIPWLCRHFGLPVPQRILDTRVAEALLVSGLNLELSLKETAQRRLGVELDKSLQTSFAEAGPVTEAQRAYAAQDARILLPLIRAQEEELHQAGLWTIWEIEKACTPVFVKMAVLGVPFDPGRLAPYLEQVRREREWLEQQLGHQLGGPYLNRLLEDYDQKLQAYQAWQEALEAERQRLVTLWDQSMAEAIAFFEEHPRQRRDAEALGPAEWDSRWKELLRDRGEWKGRKRFVHDQLVLWQAQHPRPAKPAPPPPFDPDSPKQVLEAFQALGYSDLSSVSEEQLRLYPFREEHWEVVNLLLRYRSRRKIETAFGEPLLAAVWEDGRLRPQFRQIGTASGRPTTVSPNLLQLPSAKTDQGVRQAVVAPPGYRLVVADYSQIELRLLAALSGDEQMIDLFQRGEDLHQATARLLFGSRAGEKERRIAKAVNFLTVYGGGPRRLAEVASQGGIVLSAQEAKQVIARWKESFPTAWSALEEWQESSLRRRETRSAWGRRRLFGPEEPPDEVRRAGANHVIQSSAADVMKLAMAAVDRLVSPLGAWICLQVYDELVLVVPEEKAEWTRKLVVSGMTEAARRLLGPVPAEVEAIVAESWAEKG